MLRASVRLAVEQTSFTRPANSPYDQSNAVIRQLLGEAATQGETLPGLDLDEATEVIVGAFTGMQVMSQVHSNRADLQQRLGSLWRLLLPGLANPGMICNLRLTPLPEAAAPEPEPAPEAPAVD